MDVSTGVSIEGEIAKVCEVGICTIHVREVPVPAGKPYEIHTDVWPLHVDLSAPFGRVMSYESTNIVGDCKAHGFRSISCSGTLGQGGGTIQINYNWRCNLMRCK